MHHRAVDLTGQTFGYLTALTYAGSNGKKSLWTVQCVCGVQKVVVASDLRKGHLKSCGCKCGEMISEQRRTHGLSHHPAYAVYRSMIDRCRLPTHQAWKNYGGRGIRVCERWQEGFVPFWDDMASTYQPGLTLERVDNEAGYSPQNCVWATYTQQSANRRGTILFNGMALAAYADSIGKSRSTIYYWYKKGWLTSKIAALETASSCGPATGSTA